MPTLDWWAQAGRPLMDTTGIASSDIGDAAVGSSQIAADAITSTKIVADAITSTKIATGAVTSSKIADDAVTSSQLGVNSVLSTHIGTGEVMSSKIADDAVGSSQLATAILGAIPGAAVIALSSKSSNDEWFLQVQLQDIASVNYTRHMPVRVYIGSTEHAGSNVSSTKFTAFSVATSATSSGGGPSYTLAGGLATTHVGTRELEFLASSVGLLTLSMILSTDAATTDAMHVIWAGGAYRSSDTVGSTTVAT